MSAYTIIVILEAISEKENDLKKALTKVISPSRAENACIKYHLHQDLNEPAKFILYEVWKNQEAHQKQFEKPYIISLGKQIATLLAKPYQVMFTKEIE